MHPSDPVLLDANSWTLGPMIGEGGFGSVYEASSGQQEAAIKFIPKGEASKREFDLLLPDGVRNVVPVLDRGEDADNWIIAMPRASRSLHDRIHGDTAPISLEESLTILGDVALALWDLHDKLVHRDIKPQNILELNGKWCVADFGIARLAEAATATQTYKYQGTQGYLAPERWRLEHATHATDVYSLGVVAFELLNGKLPFEGDGAQLRHGHLFESPPESEGPQGLRWLITDCLRKPPELRPTPEQFYKRLQLSMVEQPPSGFLTLVRADRDLSDKIEKADIERHATETATELRLERVEHARETLTRLSDALTTKLTDITTQTRLVEGANYSWRIELYPAELAFDPMYCDDDGRNDETDQGLPFSVIAHACIRVTQNQNSSFNSPSRSHSLWYADVERQGQFDWYEVGFMQVGSGMVPADRGKPFDLSPDSEDAVSALRETGPIVVYYPFTKLIPEDCGAFVENWASWLGHAYAGTLSLEEYDPKVRASWRH